MSQLTKTWMLHDPMLYDAKHIITPLKHFIFYLSHLSSTVLFDGVCIVTVKLVNVQLRHGMLT